MMDVNDPNTTETCKYFNNRNYISHKRRELKLVEQLNNIWKMSTQILKERLKDHENGRI